VRAQYSNYGFILLGRIIEVVSGLADALMSNRLMDAAHTRLLTGGGPVLPDGIHAHYDFGGQTSEGRRFVGHGGGRRAAGMNGELRIFPEQDA
jgi:CubicO group peptidase (beta-lactamase class C family)